LIDCRQSALDADGASVPALADFAPVIVSEGAQVAWTTRPEKFGPQAYFFSSAVSHPPQAGSRDAHLERKPAPTKRVTFGPGRIWNVARPV